LLKIVYVSIDYADQQLHVTSFLIYIVLVLIRRLVFSYHLQQLFPKVDYLVCFILNKFLNFILTVFEHRLHNQH
jgi:hypothetical protein